MAWRTNPQAVIGILGNNYDTDKQTSLTPFLRAAHAVTNNVVAIAAKKGGLQPDSDTLEQVECYLAAHYYAFQDQLYQTKSTGKANATFQGQTQMGFESTQYGRAAMDMDYSRVLAALNKGGIMRMTWLGKNPSDQIDYSDRR